MLSGYRVGCMMIIGKLSLCIWLFCFFLPLRQLFTQEIITKSVYYFSVKPSVPRMIFHTNVCMVCQSNYKCSLHLVTFCDKMFVGMFRFSTAPLSAWVQKIRSEMNRFWTKITSKTAEMLGDVAFLEFFCFSMFF